MVSILEELLSFHSWYKYGEAPFGPKSIPNVGAAKNCKSIYDVIP
jgi:hypothetical protein